MATINKCYYQLLKLNFTENFTKYKTAIICPFYVFFPETSQGQKIP